MGIQFDSMIFEQIENVGLEMIDLAGCEEIEMRTDHNDFLLSVSPGCPLTRAGGYFSWRTYHEGGLTTQIILQGFEPSFTHEWGNRDE